MRAKNWNEQERWFFRPADPGIEESFRRSNFFTIILLAILVAGLFVAALGPMLETAPMAHASPAVSKSVPRHNG
jgi:membrane associated rhomboid family serine protease